MEKTYLVNEKYGFDPILLPGGPDGIVLLHGFTASPVEVKELSNYLHERGYTISAPLLPGHGTSPEDLNQTQYEEWVLAAEAAVKDLKTRCEQVYIGGESMGGLVAMRIAETDPEVAGLLLYAPALKAFNVWATGILRHFVKYLKKSSEDDGLIWSGYNRYPISAAYQMTKLQKIVQRDLAKINQPTLLMMTKKDTMVPQDVIQLIKEGISSEVIEVHSFEESSHCILLDHEKDSAYKISFDFLQNLEKTGK